MARLYTATADWAHDEPGPVVAIGNFDGVHAGHRAVLRRLDAHARALGAPTCVLTFEPAPTAVLAPGRHQPRILQVDERVRRLTEAGVDIVIVEPFDLRFADHSAEWFAKQLLGNTLHARGVVVGYDFRFGKGRVGDAAALRAWLPGITVDEVAAHEVGGEPVSSSRIRRLVAAGAVEDATALLGRPHFLQGPVVHGDHRGRTIGFPTANVANRVELLPAAGVYATRTTVRGETHPSVTNIGVRPTFAGSEPRVESHLFDFAGDLYGEEIRVDLVARLREERRFASVDALVAQIQADAAAAREHLS
jgi:riboflavin kinase/FMN adenylyltransferase